MPYFSHIREAKKHKNKSNVLMLQYEEIGANLQGTIKQISRFLQHDLDESKIDTLIDHLNIANFRNNTAVNGQEMKAIGVLNENSNGFVRNGVTGSSDGEYRNVPGLLESAEKWIRENQNVFK